MKYTVPLHFEGKHPHDSLPTVELVQPVDHEIEIILINGHRLRIDRQGAVFVDGVRLFQTGEE